MKVKDIIKTKGSKVYTISENATLMAATADFFAKKIGSLVVMNDFGDFVGIISPNDILKAIHQGCSENCALQKVHQVMTRQVICASEEDTIDYIQAIMTENRIRHVPIMERKEIKGLVSIGDIVKAQITIRDVENKYLIDYIEGKYPA